MPANDDDEEKTDPATPKSKVSRKRPAELTECARLGCGHALVRHTQHGSRRCLHGTRQADGRPRPGEERRCACTGFVEKIAR
jgi:hypothetical protein